MKNLFDLIKYKFFSFILYLSVRTKLRVGQIYRDEDWYYFIVSLDSKNISMEVWKGDMTARMNFTFQPFALHMYPRLELIDETISIDELSTLKAAATVFLNIDIFVREQK